MPEPRLRLAHVLSSFVLALPVFRQGRPVPTALLSRQEFISTLPSGFRSSARRIPLVSGSHQKAGARSQARNEVHLIASYRLLLTLILTLTPQRPYLSRSAFST